MCYVSASLLGSKRLDETLPPLLVLESIFRVVRVAPVVWLKSTQCRRASDWSTSDDSSMGRPQEFSLCRKPRRFWPRHNPRLPSIPPMNLVFARLLACLLACLLAGWLAAADPADPADSAAAAAAAAAAM